MKIVGESIEGGSSSVTTNEFNTILKNNNITIDDFTKLRLKDVSSLTDNEIALLKSIRESITMPDSTTTLQKVIPTGDIDKYLDGTYTQVGGFVTKADDVAQLSSYDDIYNSLRLDYPNTAYNMVSDESLAVIRYTTDDVSQIKIPFSAEFGGTTTGAPPFTGNGFTKALNGQVIPEFQCTTYLEINDGAQLFEISKDGTETLKGIYSELQGKFVEVK